MIQFSDRQVSYKQFLNDVSKAVCKKLEKDLNPRGKWLTTNEAAELLGVTPGHLRHKKDKYCAVKRGIGKQARLMFDRDVLMNWAK